MDKKTIDEYVNDQALATDVLGSISHLCWIYGNESEQLDAFEPSVISALLQQKQCLMAIPKGIWAKAALGLASENVDLAHYLDTGQIILSEPQDMLLTDGRIDIDIIIGRLQAASKRARARGWEGLSIVLDASDFIDKADISTWLEYELRADYECSLGPCMILCMYDSRQLSGEFLAMLVKSHPIIGIGSGLKINPFYMQNNSKQAQ